MLTGEALPCRASSYSAGIQSFLWILVSHHPSQAPAEMDAEQQREQLSATPGKLDHKFRHFAQFSTLNHEHLMASLAVPTPHSPSSCCSHPTMDTGQDLERLQGKVLNICRIDVVALRFQWSHSFPPWRWNSAPAAAAKRFPLYTWHLYAEDANRAEMHVSITEDSDILCTFPLITSTVRAPSSVGHGASFMQQWQQKHLLF